jgi:phenylalanine-4-hydroxylase
MLEPVLPAGSADPTTSPVAERDLVWRELWRRQRPRLEGRMHGAFIDGLRRSGLDGDRMPRHAELSRRLHGVCGWRIETVPGLIPARDFFALLRDRRFPSPDWIRGRDELALFGHVPQLCSPVMTDVLELLAERARDADDAELERIERLYWHTIEFGLARERGELRAIGAGLASSVAELERSLTDRAIERPELDPAAVRERDFETQRAQDVYFVAGSLEELRRAILS